ncbi:phage tail protein [Acidovorax sp. ACV02]|uniref:phage tail protein n=1 Tax=Acidovorax sp. ACV02 TaxID=2769310 RepID=UPI001783425E|nr:tail fiber protein [Acidovorax sp. ACV02]MBD9407994.1 phage tail protein [Acidovorax sp. ACV02]
MATAPIMGEIKMFAGNFAPKNWMFCQGQLLSISQNSALFAILGTTYGGNGVSTFALPDLRGRVPVGTGQGPGLPSMDLGEVAGTPTQTLTINNLPSHNHTVTGSVSASTSIGTLTGPGSGAVPAASNHRNAQYAPGASADTTLPVTSLTTGATGNNSPISVMQPHLGMNYIIAVQGVFPSRN